ASVVISLLRRVAPRSSLFPYTTLFRSGTVIIDEPRLPTLPEVTFAVVTRNPATRAAAAVASALQRHSPDLRTRRPAGAAGRRVRDRKSTRLNSSHVSISYAVFCLKKKN